MKRKPPMSPLEEAIREAEREIDAAIVRLVASADELKEDRAKLITECIKVLTLCRILVGEKKWV
jgi:hypothetical protein